MAEGRRVGILSLSPILDDPRVRRQADALHEAGDEVTVFGLPGGRSAPPPWTIRTTDELHKGDAAAAPFDQSVLVGVGAALPSEPGAAQRLRCYRALWSRLTPTVAGALQQMWPLLVQIWPQARRRSVEEWLWRIDFYARLAAIRFDKDRADELYWTLGSGHADLLSLAQSHRADLWIANDWNTLPVAALIAERQGAPFFYDSHELAYDEHGESWIWSRFLRPAIFAIEHKYIGTAAAVTAVSSGIAGRLQSLHRLPVRPTRVRNMPLYRETALRPVGTPIRVLYHGIIVPGRGIEACIRSVRLWRPEFDLTLRGPVAEGYRAELETVIAQAGVGGRVRLAPPVPTDALVGEASQFDVGLFALPGHSRHNIFALPNKMFEYAMAGLCLCVSDMPEMKATVLDHEMGVVLRATTPASIAEAINSLDAARVERFKAAALRAARRLCWDAERGVMLDLYVQALAQPPPERPPLNLQQPLLPPSHSRMLRRIRPDELECPEYWRRDGAAIESQDGAVRITCPATSWSYAASAPVSLEGVDFRTDYCWIEVCLDEADVGAAVSLFDLAGNATHFEQSIPRLRRSRSIWIVPTRPVGDFLMFRTGERGRPAQLVFREARLFTARKQGPGGGDGPATSRIAGGELL